MKRNFKILSLVLSLTIIFSLTGCRNNGTTASSDIVAASSKKDAVSSVASSVVSETVSSEESVSSKTETSSEETVSTPPEKPKKETVETITPTQPTTVTIAPEFEVYDPENTRGLSEKAMGYGHGQQTSISNQNTFDKMNNVEALAIDKVSGVKRVFLTFDCGYEYNNLTLSILDTLKEKNVKAAFFCTLSYIKNNPEKIKRMIDEGHIVGNHSVTHPVFPEITRTKMAEEVYGVHKYLQEKYGYTPKYFRFPTGSYSESSLELVTSVGYKSIFWSFAYKDWETANQPAHDTALETIKKGFYPGSVLLLHAVSETNTKLLGQIIDYGVSEGYTFATLDDYYS